MPDPGQFHVIGETRPAVPVLGRSTELEDILQREAIDVMTRGGFLDKAVDAKALYTNAIWERAVKG